MSRDSFLGQRVRLTQKAIDAKLHRRGKQTGVIVGIKQNAVTYLWVLRDGQRHAQMYDVEMWEIDDTATDETK